MNAATDVLGEMLESGGKVVEMSLVLSSVVGLIAGADVALGSITISDVAPVVTNDRSV